MAYMDKPATELNRDVWTFVEIEGHTIQEAMDHFGIAKRTVYQHINQYRDRNPLPDAYIDNLRKRAKAIAAKGLKAIEDNLDGDKPDLHAAIQIAKGTGVLVEKTETETTLYVTEGDPNERFREVLERMKSPVPQTPTSTEEGKG